MSAVRWYIFGLFVLFLGICGQSLQLIGSAPGIQTRASYGNLHVGLPSHDTSNARIKWLNDVKVPPKPNGHSLIAIPNDTHAICFKCQFTTKRAGAHAITGSRVRETSAWGSTDYADWFRNICEIKERREAGSFSWPSTQSDKTVLMAKRQDPHLSQRGEKGRLRGAS